MKSSFPQDAAPGAGSGSIFETAFELASIGMAIVSLEGNVRQANLRLCELFGYPKELLLRKTWQEVTPPDELETDLALVSRLVAGEMDSYEREKRFLRNGGNAFWGHLKVKLVRDGQGDPDFFVCLVDDITERKSVERHLAESERRYRSLFENMNGGFVLFEAVQDERGAPVDLRILAANKPFEKTTGLRVSDAIGWCLKQLLPGIERDTFDWIGTYGRVALTGEPIQFEQGSSTSPAMRCGWPASLSR